VLYVFLCRRQERIWQCGLQLTLCQLSLCFCFGSSNGNSTPIPSPVTTSFCDSPLFSFVTSPLFYSKLKTYLFYISYPLVSLFLPDCLHGLLCGQFLLSYWFLFLVLPYFFVSVPCARLSWPYCQLLSTCKSTILYHCQGFHFFNS